jgi:hypothetical protein
LWFRDFLGRRIARSVVTALIIGLVGSSALFVASDREAACRDLNDAIMGPYLWQLINWGGGHPPISLQQEIALFIYRCDW